MVPASTFSLGADVVAAIAQAKSDFRLNRLREYQGQELLDPHGGVRGAKFLEAYVSVARPGDPRGTAGNRRLVLKVQSEHISEMYFSKDHYLGAPPGK